MQTAERQNKSAAKFKAVDAGEDHDDEVGWFEPVVGCRGKLIEANRSG